MHHPHRHQCRRRPLAGSSKGCNDTTRLGRPADKVVDSDTNELFVADGNVNGL
jgi:hypothetical protein